MKLLARNLTRTLDEAELLALFEAHGEVQSCHLVLDSETGKSKGFGFVEMSNDNEAKAAIEALNGSKVAGNKIRVKLTDETTPASRTNEQASPSIWPEAGED